MGSMDFSLVHFCLLNTTLLYGYCIFAGKQPFLEKWESLGCRGDGSELAPTSQDVAGMILRCA